MYVEVVGMAVTTAGVVSDQNVGTLVLDHSRDLFGHVSSGDACEAVFRLPIKT